MGMFKKGIVLGGLLGAGLMWLNTTQKGRQTRDEILDRAADVYVKLKQQILASKQYKNLNKNEYVKLVKDFVDKYAIDNGLAENVKKMVVKLVSAQWKNISDEVK